MKESGGHAVKLEGGAEIAESIKRILTAGIPVMGHLGLTPQSIYKFGTYTVRAKEEAEAQKLIEDAMLLEQLLRHCSRKNPFRPGSQSSSCCKNTYHRYRCRQCCRRSGIGTPRYVRNE